jgi:hypothetical protein
MMGETSAAVSGGVNIMLTPQTTARICLLQALSPVGRCKTFDDSADGYGRGEGFTVAYLRYASPQHNLSLTFDQSQRHKKTVGFNLKIKDLADAGLA